MRVSKVKTARVEIDLDGPQGNAYVILGYADKFGEELNFSKEKRVKIYEEMTAGDYDNLIDVFENYFGDLVYLYSDNL